MDMLEAIKSRHSVRDFTDKKIEGQVEAILRKAISEANVESGLNLQLFLNEPKAFKSRLFNLGRFNNCKNYLALIGPKGMDEKFGYYGEKIVLKAQELGLNSCWVGSTYNKFGIPYKVNKSEKIRMVIALGYGANQGKPHISKEITDLYQIEGGANTPLPEWFIKGMEAAQLAPTSVNQQKFLMILKDKKVIAKALPAINSKIDIGIVKYHFEVGAGKGNFQWA